MLKSVKDACVLRPNALDIRVSDQVERLDQLISEGDGKDFLALLKDLWVEIKG